MSAATVAQTASNAYAPVRTSGFTPPGPMASFLSDINMLLSGVGLFAAGTHVLQRTPYSWLARQLIRGC